MDAPPSRQAWQPIQPEDEDNEDWDPNDISYDLQGANPAVKKSSGLYASDSNDDESDSYVQR